MSLRSGAFVVIAFFIGACSGPKDLRSPKHRIAPEASENPGGAWAPAAESAPDNLDQSAAPETTSDDLQQAAADFSATAAVELSEPVQQGYGSGAAAAQLAVADPTPTLPTSSAMDIVTVASAAPTVLAPADSPTPQPSMVTAASAPTPTPAPVKVPSGTVVSVNQCQPYSCGYSCLTCGPSCSGENFGSTDPAACAARWKTFCPSTWKASWSGPNLVGQFGVLSASACPSGTTRRNATVAAGACGITRYECVAN